MELRADRDRLQRGARAAAPRLAVERFFPDGPFARLPMTGDRSSIVWALDDRLSASVLALDDAGFLGEVADRFGADLGGLGLASPRWSYPLALVLADSYTAHRAVLVGRCRARHPPDRGPGLEPGAPRRRVGGRDRGRPAAPRPRSRRCAGPGALCRLAAVRRHGAGGGHRRDQPPVRQRSSTGPPGARGRACRRAADRTAQALLHAARHGPGRRPAAGHARASRCDQKKTARPSRARQVVREEG